MRSPAPGPSAYRPSQPPVPDDRPDRRPGSRPRHAAPRQAGPDPQTRRPAPVQGGYQNVYAGYETAAPAYAGPPQQAGPGPYQDVLAEPRGPYQDPRRAEPGPPPGPAGAAQDWPGPDDTGRSRRRTVLITIPVAIGAIACAGGAYLVWPHLSGGSGAVPSSSPTSSAGPAGAPSTAATQQTPAYAKTGPGTFTTAKGGTAKVGHGGTLIRYKVQVENKIGVDAAGFARQVDAILAAPRGWTMAGKWSFQRVSSGKVNFVVRLASVKTSARLCKAGGLNTDGKTNCSIPGDVVMDTMRWVLLNPYYQGKADLYHALAVNHEVGHALGFHHMTCPGKGKPAPVMMQQMFGLKGCVINAWPYNAHAKLITGPPVKGQ